VRTIVVFLLLACSSESVPNDAAMSVVRDAPSAMTMRDAISIAHDSGGCVDCSETMVPSPLISRGRPTSGHPEGTEHAVDGFDEGWATAWEIEAPVGATVDAELIIDVGQGASRVLVGVLGAAGGHYTVEHDGDTHGGAAISAYSIAVSPSGADGSWTTLVDLPPSSDRSMENNFIARGHVIDFEGMRYLRYTPVKYFAQADWIDSLDVAEISVHDVSAGVRDTWVFLGGKNYRGVFDRGPDESDQPTPRFADFVHQAHPQHWPYVINAPEIFFTLETEVDHLPAILDVNPEMHFWGISFGSIEVSERGMSVEEYRNLLERLITAIATRGKEPIPTGIESVSRVWAEAVSDLYGG
jgi:hypothetical protein